MAMLCNDHPSKTGQATNLGGCMGLDFTASFNRYFFLHTVIYHKGMIWKLYDVCVNQWPLVYKFWMTEWKRKWFCHRWIVCTRLNYFVFNFLSPHQNFCPTNIHPFEHTLCDNAHICKPGFARDQLMRNMEDGKSHEQTVQSSFCM